MARARHGSWTLIGLRYRSFCVSMMGAGGGMVMGGDAQINERGSH